MKWEFTSWGKLSDNLLSFGKKKVLFTNYFFYCGLVPLVSRMCPSDTYKVYKQGSKVRIDTTLLGFDQTDWHRGNTSYIFHGQSK